MSHAHRRGLALALSLILAATADAQVQHLPPMQQATPQPAPTQTLIVDPSGAGDHTTITAAVNAAIGGAHILVKAGIYVENGIDFNDRQLVIRSVDGPLAAIIDGTPAAPATTANPIFIVQSQQTQDSIIDGFKLVNARAVHGGAIYCYQSSPKIINNEITNCSAGSGGAIFVQSGSPTIAGNDIHGNGYGIGSGSSGPDAVSGGGLCLIGCWSVVEDNRIVNNRATFGGGLFIVQGSNVTLTNNLVQDNAAERGNGGGLAVLRGSAIQATFNTVSDNFADLYGGGMWFAGSSALLPTVVDSMELSGNVAEYSGGGLMCENATGTFTSCIITDNQALTHAGGGVFCLGAGESVFAQSVISRNVAGDAGGGVAIDQANVTVRRCSVEDNDLRSFTNGAGAGILVSSASARIKRNLISGNGSGNSGQSFVYPCPLGGGIYYDGGEDLPNSNGIIESNWITENQVAENGAGAGVYLKKMGPGSSLGSNVVAKNFTSGAGCDGAGVLIEDSSTFRFYNNTIAYNVNGSTRLGGGVLFASQTQPFTIHNSILWENVAQGDPVVESAYLVPGATVPFVTSSDVSANGPVSPTSWTQSGSVLHFVDPQFVDPNTNWRLQGTSTLIGIGNNAVVNMTTSPIDLDIDGTPRIAAFGSGGIVDLGADEF